MSIHAAAPPAAPPSGPSCPRCNASRVVRWGWVRTVRAPPRRRFRCKGCRRTFSEHTGKAPAGSWYPGRWPELCRELVAQTSIRLTARRLGVSPSTAFRWRHRALQALAAHRERTDRRQLGSTDPEPSADPGPESGAGGSGAKTEDGTGAKTEDGTGAKTEDGTGAKTAGGVGGTRGVVGVMGLPFKVTRRRGPEVWPPRFFRILVAADSAGRVAMDHDVPSEIVGPPGTPLPLSDWIWSGRAWARFRLGPADRVPSPRRLLERWCAPGAEIRWVGWRFYPWSEVAAELGMTAVWWAPGGVPGGVPGQEQRGLPGREQRAVPGRTSESTPAGDAQRQEAIRARELAVGLRRWLRRYRGVSTRWLRGYLALFAELHESRKTSDRRAHPGEDHPSGTDGRPEAFGLFDVDAHGGLSTGTRRRHRRQRWATLAWRLIAISVRGTEGPVAKARRCWVR